MAGKGVDEGTQSLDGCESQTADRRQILRTTIKTFRSQTGSGALAGVESASDAILENWELQTWESLVCNERMGTGTRVVY